MKIGIDARTILNPRKGDAIGAGHYIFQLIKNLLKLDEKNEYVLFFNSSVRQKDVRKFKRENVKIVFYPFYKYKKYLPVIYDEVFINLTFTKEDLDVLHVTSEDVRVPRSYRGKVLTTFHDLGVYKVPDCYKSMERSRAKSRKRFMAKKSDYVIAVSKSVKRNLQNMFNLNEDKISVIYGGVDQRFFQDVSDNTKKIPKKFGINKKYILFLGTISSVKNVTRLLYAFLLFKDARMKKIGKERCDYQLLLAGKMGQSEQHVKYIIKDMNLSADVKLADYVIGDELVPLFKHAKFFVLPSLYEGFGAMILEAFATKTPAILSDIPAIREIAEDSALLVNPEDTRKIAKAMNKFASDIEFRESFVEKGFERAKEFNWEKTAEETLEVYEKINN